MAIPITGEKLYAVMNAVWSGLLRDSLERLPVGVHPSPYVDLVCAWLGFSGFAHGGVLVSCETSVAQEGASRMFDVDAENAGTDLMYDFLGEYANIIAGHVHECYAGPITVAPPIVGEEDELPERCLNETAQLEVGSRFGGGTLYVHVFEWDAPDPQ
jgi:CheY-specific phosphatase CheX